MTAAAYSHPPPEAARERLAGLAAEAERRRAWQAALGHWQEHVAQFPGHADGHAGVARVLLELKRLDDAGTALEEGRRRFPKDRRLVTEAARLAAARSDWDASLALWEELRRLAPDLPRGYVEASRLLRQQRRLGEADALIRKALLRFPGDASVAIEAARIEETSEDWAKAAQCWAALRAAAPNNLSGYWDGAIALVKLGELREAEAVLGAALDRFPNESRIAIRYASLAAEQQNWEEAERRYTDLQQRFPNEEAGHLGLASMLARAGEREKADTVLEQAAERLPGSIAIRLAHARLPLDEGSASPMKRQRAAKRMEQVACDFPDNAAVHKELIQLLCDAGEFDRAETAATRAMRRVPNDLELMRARARISMDCGDYAEAARRFAAAVKLFPGVASLITSLADAHSRSGNHGAAEAVLADAAERYPASPQVTCARAILALRRGDARQGMAHWAAAQQCFPGSAVVAQHRFEVQLLAAGLGIDLAQPATPAVSSKPEQPEATPDMRKLVARFESLGGLRYGCEFGFVQRALGVDVLALLRWTGIGPTKLAAAIEAGFEGVGEPDQTELLHPETEGGEYMAVDTRFGMVTHTFVTPRDFAAERMFEQICLRQQFLRRRFLRTLAEGSKILVYRLTRRQLSEAELDRLHRAIRAHGPSTLLYVQAARPGIQPDTVEQRAPGLLVGHIERFAMSPDGKFLGHMTEHWAEICRRAAALVPLPGEGQNAA